MQAVPLETFENLRCEPYTPVMPRQEDPAVTRLLNELREWCAEEYGRQAQLARMLRVTRSKVNDWVRGRTMPSLGEGLALMEFLRKERPRKSKGPKSSEP